MHRIVNGDIMRFAAHYHGPKFHAVLCDPPYELGFMNKSWDSRGVSFRAETWLAIRSLLAPGAHLLAFGGTRTFHRIAVAIEDAGFEIRDTLGWLYGTGFPKSHDVSKAIDREAGAERETIRMKPRAEKSGTFSGNMVSYPWIEKSRLLGYHEVAGGEPATDAARAWQGYGTALKPAWEPVIVARNPLEGTVAQNALEHGTGALNIDGARVSWANKADADAAAAATGFANSRANGKAIQSVSIGKESRVGGNTYHPLELLGRWPANIIYDGSDETAEVLGDAARFFYCAKAGKREREEGMDGFEVRVASVGNVDETSGRDSTKPGNQYGEGSRKRAEAGLPPTIPRANYHPTVKPLALTQYLAALILPPQHVESRILVPFAGSGSECIGAALAGWHTVVGVEREADYARIARARLEHWTRERATQEAFV